MQIFLAWTEGPGAAGWFTDRSPLPSGQWHPDTVCTLPHREPHMRRGHRWAQVYPQAEERALTKTRARTLKPVFHPRISLSLPSAHQGYPWRKKPDQHHTSILPLLQAKLSSDPHHFHILIRPAVLRLPSLTNTRNY